MIPFRSAIPEHDITDEDIPVEFWSHIKSDKEQEDDGDQ
jgi:hypothetical protein